MDDPSTQNFLRLVTLIWEHGTSALRQLLIKHRTAQINVPFADWLQPRLTEIQKDVKSKSPNKRQYQPLFPSQFALLNSPAVKEDDLDISLITYLFNKYFSKSAPKRDKQALEELRTIRNLLAHGSKSSFSNTEFEEKWTFATCAILHLNPTPGSKDILENVKTGPLDLEKAQEYETHLKYQKEEEIKSGLLLVETLEKGFLALEKKIAERPAANVFNTFLNVTNVTNCTTGQTQAPCLALSTNTYASVEEDLDCPSNAFFNFNDGELRQEDLVLLMNCPLPSNCFIVYKQLPKESTLFKDILSMWNTPDRGKAYILIGVTKINKSKKS